MSEVLGDKAPSCALTAVIYFLGIPLTQHTFSLEETALSVGGLDTCALQQQSKGTEQATKPRLGYLSWNYRNFSEKELYVFVRGDT